MIYQNKIHELLHGVICCLSVAFNLFCGVSGMIMSITVYLVYTVCHSAEEDMLLLHSLFFSVK